jgi:hypothetical protein
MFSDTLTLTINGVAKTLTRVNQDKYSSEYRLRETDGVFSLIIRNSTFKDKTRNMMVVDRHNVEFIHSLFPVAPALVGVKRKAYFVLDNDPGDPLTSAQKFDAALMAFATEANILKLLNWES